MNNPSRKIIRFLTSSLSNFAYFEDRRYEKVFGDQYIFINLAFLITTFKIKPISSDYNYTVVPLSLEESERKKYICILDLKQLISNDDYNNILVELLTRAQTYDQVNTVFPHLLSNDKFSSVTLNKIISLCLSKHKNSFEAQKNIWVLIEKNIGICDVVLVRRVIMEFRKFHELLNPDKYSDIIKRINDALPPDNIINQRKEDISYHAHSFDDEIENGMDELRKWDKEDPSWRISNDLE